jgi:hypothetical protein
MQVKVPRATKNQRAVLLQLKRNGAWRQGPWFWGSRHQTFLILKSLQRKGLVEPVDGEVENGFDITSLGKQSLEVSARG